MDVVTLLYSNNKEALFGYIATEIVFSEFGIDGGEQHAICGQEVNLREGPSTQAKSISKSYGPTSITRLRTIVNDEGEEWMQGCTLNGLVWVHSDYVE